MLCIVGFVVNFSNKSLCYISENRVFYNASSNDPETILVIPPFHVNGHGCSNTVETGPIVKEVMEKVLFCIKN